MNRLARLLFALALLLMVFRTPSAIATNPIGVETNHLVLVNAGQQINSFAFTFKLPPNPVNPSALSKSSGQFQIHNQADGSQGTYFGWESVALVPHGFGFARGYSVEVTGTVNGVRQDPLVRSDGSPMSAYAFPGDTLSWWWLGPGDPNATAHGQPYAIMQNDNGSGMGAGGWMTGNGFVTGLAGPAPGVLAVNFTGPYMDAIQQPYLSMQADPRWTPDFGLAGEHNCWGDFPAHNGGVNTSSTKFQAYYVTVDGAVHWATFQPPTILLPAFVDFNGHSLPGCALSVSTQSTKGGPTYSIVSSYGG